MNLVYLTASACHGGPERQMLGLARSLPAAVRTVFLSFAEGGRCGAFLAAARRGGFEAHALENDVPHLRAALRELTGHLARSAADVLLCHGCKANLLGRPAARRLGIPAVAVSRGWTGASAKVCLYEALDRRHLRFMDCVVCVCAAQAARVYRAGVRPGRIRVIPDAVDPERFAQPDPCGVYFTFAAQAEHYGQLLSELCPWWPEADDAVWAPAGALSKRPAYAAQVGP